MKGSILCRITIKRGKLVGRRTAGSSGNPLKFDLPGGGLAWVCTKKDVFPDGTEYIGFGIAPDASPSLDQRCH